MTNSWDGVERRQEGGDPVTRAEVRSLRTGVDNLTTAFQIRTDDLGTLLKNIALMFVMMFIVQTIISILFVNHLDHGIERKHEQILCEVALTPEQKAVLGDKACA